MARHRAIAVVASARPSCRVCCGSGQVEVRALPAGAWIPTRCPHCRSNGVPYFPLPWLPEPERNTA